ncbi:hypothetical protein ACS0TY_024270 [Phlomoides rotata]
MSPISLIYCCEITWSSFFLLYCERNWSTYSFIQPTKRNQITLECVEDLVYVHNNLRLLSRKAPQYNKNYF